MLARSMALGPSTGHVRSSIMITRDWSTISLGNSGVIDTLRLRHVRSAKALMNVVYAREVRR